MGYRPNPLVTALMCRLKANRTQWKAVIGCIDFRQEEYAVQKNPIYTPALSGMADRAHSLGFSLEWHYPGRDAGIRRKLHKILTAKNIHGIILMPYSAGEGGWQNLLPWEHYACAAFGYTWEVPDFHRAGPDHYGNMQIAYRKLRSMGRSRIALVVSDYMENVVKYRWLGAYLSECYKQCPLSNPLVFDKRPEELSHFIPWLEKSNPDAIIVHDAQAFDQFIKKHSVKISENVVVAELSWRKDKSSFCCGVSERMDFVGTALIDLVIEQLNNNERGVPIVPKLKLIRGEWNDAEFAAQSIK